MRIVAWKDEAVLTVPVGSLFRHGEDWAVFVAEGQHVVLHPPDTLTDGARVRVRQQ